MPKRIPPVMGNINGIPLSTEPSPQRLSQPPLILNEQDPHQATIPQTRRPPETKQKALASDHAGSCDKGTVGVRGARPPGQYDEVEAKGEARKRRRRGDPLNQPGGHWERAADT